MTRVLLVDDEPAVRNGLATWLNQRRFSVLTASNLGSAISAARKYRPHVVLIDVKLGAQDGLQYIDLLRSAGLEIPCIVLAATAGPYDGFKAKELGIIDLIEKHSSPEKIAEALRRAAAGSGVSRSIHPSPTATHNLTCQPLATPQLPASLLSHRMQTAIDYIRANFTNVHLSAEDVADHIGVTPEHLSRMFHRSLGKNPSTITNELRIRRAQQLLADPRLNLSEIANLCGYRSTRQLNGWSRRLCGESPALRRLAPGSIRTT